MIIISNQLWFFCAHNFFSPGSLFLWCDIYTIEFSFVVLFKDPSLAPPEVALSIWTHYLSFFSWSNHLVYKPQCILYNQKVFHFLVNHCGCQIQPKWQSEKQSPNGNRECKNVSLRHLPETCWCIICQKMHGNSNFMDSEKCCLYREFLNFFGLFIKASQSFYPHQLVHLLG